MATIRNLELRVIEFRDDLAKEIRNKDNNPDPTRCTEIIDALVREVTTTPTSPTKTARSKKKSDPKDGTPGSKKTASASATVKSLSPSLSPSSEEMMKKSLTQSIRCFRRYKRTALNPENAVRWESAIVSADSLRCMTAVAGGGGATTVEEEREARGGKSSKSDSLTKRVGSAVGTDQTLVLPTSATSYRERLVTHKKEIYKDPPVLPPPSITVYPYTCPLPTLNKKTGQLTFLARNNADDEDEDEDEDDDGTNDALKEALKLFRPNRSPEEILRAGAFGGTYYRPITSSVTNVRYNANQVLQDSLRPEWIQGLDKSTNYIP